MKIALISPYDYSYSGGVPSHIAQLENHLLKRGHHVKVLAPCSSKPLDPNVIPIGTPIPVPSGDSIARITLSLTLSRTVKKVLNRYNFDIIHLHEPLTPMLPLFVLENSNSINIGTFHAYHGKPRGYKLFRTILNKWFNKLHGHIAVSKPAQDFVGKCFQADYRIIPNGVDTTLFHPGAKPIEALKDGKINILYVGRLEKRKGIKYLLQAYKIVKDQNPMARLILVGPGENLRKRYKKYVKDNNLKDVVFIGCVPNEELPRYYASADIFCAPSTGNESFGIVLLEAMASGKPVIATNIEGYSEVVQDKIQGLLVPPKDAYTLADKINILIKEEALRMYMGFRGEARAAEFSWEKVTQQVLDYYYLVSLKQRYTSSSNKVAIF